MIQNVVMKFTLTILFFLISSCASSSTEEKGKFVAPYDGEKFQNIEPTQDKSFFTLLKWKFTSIPSKWPEWVDTKPGNVLKQRTDNGEIHWMMINHASVLIQMDGVNILTDPIWSERTSPVSWAGPKRVTNPGLKFEDLPPIDYVLISHNHYDHLDLPTLVNLKEKHDSLFIVGLKNRKLLESEGIKKILEMDWWQTETKDAISIKFVPAQHWSARSLSDKREALWGGFVIEGSKKIYFAGDTGYGKFFKLIREKIGSPDISFIPIGAYEPRWFMKPFHVNPEEAVQGHLDLGSKLSVGVHFGTFQLTDEGYDQPAKDLQLALQKYQVGNFLVPTFGKLEIYDPK
jgi:L-ascorbate metabolism protein UlaG (beta-lactamase superfamily)